MKCCERDTDEDGNCPIHSSVGVLRHAPAQGAAAEPTREEATRDFLGRVVREAWVSWAERQPNPKASWLVPWADLSESDREADRCIGESVAGCVAHNLAALRQSLASAEARAEESATLLDKPITVNTGPQGVYNVPLTMTGRGWLNWLSANDVLLSPSPSEPAR